MAEAVVIGIWTARRPRRPQGERLELPALEDVDAFLAELEEERFFARGRGDWMEAREATELIGETLVIREQVVRRARLRVLKGGRRA